MSPELNGHSAYTESQPQREDEPGGALSLRIQERHVERVCRKSFSRQRPGT